MLRPYDKALPSSVVSQTRLQIFSGFALRDRRRYNNFKRDLFTNGMRNYLIKLSLLSLLAASWGLGCLSSLAQNFFTLQANGDLIATFRKAGAHKGTNDLVVFLGSVTNFIALPLGTTITISNVQPARLTDAFSSDYTYLQWSVLGANLNPGAPWVTPLGSFPQSTWWYTAPRTNIANAATSLPRLATAAQASLATLMLNISSGANSIGSQLPGGTNANNNPILVREPNQPAYVGPLLSTWIADKFDSTIGDLTGTVTRFNFEQTTPAPFSSAVRSDFYEAAPAPLSRPLTYYTDPISGNTTNVYHVGYFDLSPAGVMTFTRDTNNVSQPPSTPPPPPILSGEVSANPSGVGQVVSISFGTTNGATYTVLHTNFDGLTSPMSTWAVLGKPIPGTGGTVTVSQTNQEAGQVYTVKAQ